MHFDGWDTIEGRHLVFAYAAIFLIQGGYFAWVLTRWLGLRTASPAGPDSTDTDIRTKK